MAELYKIIDNHVHIAGPGDQYTEDLYWSKKFRKGIGFAALKVLKGWIFKPVTDQMMLNTLLKQAGKLKKVDRLLILAFDNVYTVDGGYRGPHQDNEDLKLSTIYVSNVFVRDLCRNNPELLFGLSVHPFREDALVELDKYKEEAVLCKWIASSQLIDMDPENSAAQVKLERFYSKLAEIKLPLLFHTGVETSIPSPSPGCEKYNSPEYIEKALKIGATVILAHCGCSYFDWVQDNEVKKVIALFRKIEAEGLDWKLYADISALFSPFRDSKVLKEIFTNIPASRLVYGSDFPNPAKGRKEFFLRPFLRFSRTNLFNRYHKIASKWLKRYYSEEDVDLIESNLHRILISHGRGHLLD
jgi:predicted TIM-barrel fold metal-dependent hydrolase